MDREVALCSFTFIIMLTCFCWWIAHLQVEGKNEREKERLAREREREKGRGDREREDTDSNRIYGHCHRG